MATLNEALRDLSQSQKDSLKEILELSNSNIKSKIIQLRNVIQFLSQRKTYVEKILQNIDQLLEESNAVLLYEEFRGIFSSLVAANIPQENILFFGGINYTILKDTKLYRQLIREKHEIDWLLVSYGNMLEALLNFSSQYNTITSQLSS